MSPEVKAAIELADTAFDHWPHKPETVREAFTVGFVTALYCDGRFSAADFETVVPFRKD